ncbi:MAG: response regulator transcription factor [Verrucomicrobia bacterium]|nr:response regulator transcription factor [Verrucomicrobiota bacterium]
MAKMSPRLEPQTVNPTGNPITVAVVEDVEGIRENLAALLNRAPGYRCVGAYPDAERAVAALRESRPEVILMDINLPGTSGIEATRAVKEFRPDARIVMLTVYEESKALFDSLKAGACGYLLKRTPPEKILEAIREARAGGVPLNPQMAAKVAEYFRHLGGPSGEVGRLSERERQVLELMAEGFLYKEIADRLHIQTDTVHQFTKRIYEKLHVHSRTEAVVKFLQR